MGFELVYIPQNYPSEYFVKLMPPPVQARRADGMTNQRSPDLKFCDKVNNEIVLTGLDLARGALGFPRCNSNRMEPRLYRRDIDDIDKLFLVDDRSGLSPRLRNFAEAAVVEIDGIEMIRPTLVHRSGGWKHLFIGERYFHVRNLDYSQWFREISQVVAGSPLPDINDPYSDDPNNDVIDTPVTVPQRIWSDAHRRAQAQGLILDGVQLPDTSDLVRNTLDNDDLSWQPRTFGTVASDGNPRQIVGHWTAGENEGTNVVRNMKNRQSRRDPTRRLRVGIHFVIGLPDGSEFAPILQCSDPVLTGCVHVGSRIVNRSSVGVEITNAASTRVSYSRPDRGVEERAILGRMYTWTKFYPEQIRSWIWLCNILTDSLDIPRNAFRGDRRMGARELRSYDGVLEHWNVGDTQKLDAGGWLTEALVDGGYTTVN